MPRPALGAVSEPVKQLSLSLLVLQHTIAFSVVGMPVPLVLTAFHTLPRQILNNNNNNNNNVKMITITIFF